MVKLTGFQKAALEEAQQKIVQIIRRLDETGEIILARGGEDAVLI